MDTTTSTAWIFIAIMTVGVTYLLISIVLGDLIDFDTDTDVDTSLDGDGAEARGLSCSVISVFLAGFGAVGLLGSLSGFPLIPSIIAGVVFGIILGRSMTAILQYVMRQQSNDLLTTDALIGSFARVTVDIPAGQTGEALVESDTVIKYATKAVSDEVILKKGDYVEIIDVKNGRIYVKKKHHLED